MTILDIFAMELPWVTIFPRSAGPFAIKITWFQRVPGGVPINLLYIPGYIGLWAEREMKEKHSFKNTFGGSLELDA